MNVVHTLSASAARHPGRPALQFQGRATTFAELTSAIHRLGGGLRGLGLAPGDRVGLLLANSPEYVLAYYAGLAQGLALVPLNPVLKAAEVAHILHDCQAPALVVDQTLLPLVDAIRGEASHLERVIVAGVPTTAGDVSLSSLQAGPDLAPEELDGNHIAHIVYTSGTTGRPKGAMITHGNLGWMIGALTDFYAETGGDSVVCALPLFHAYALLQCMLAPLSAGARMVLLERFTPDGVMATIQEERATIFFGVPTMYVMMLNAGGGRYDLSSLRLCVSGGASIPVEVLRRFQATTGVPICEGYGLSEVTVMCICNPPYGVQKAGSIGRPLPGLEARIVGPDDQELPMGQSGEIVVRGPSVMRGYWGRPEATAEALRGGWLHTGDVGRRDEDGYFYVVDRINDAYIRGGYNVYPREVEEVLYTHPAVSEAAVVGVPDPVFGEEGVAFVTLATGRAADPSELIEHCRARLADYKVPRRVELVEALPKSSTGKVLKRELRARYVSA